MREIYKNLTLLIQGLLQNKLKKKKTGCFYKKDTNADGNLNFLRKKDKFRQDFLSFILSMQFNWMYV